MKHDSRQPDLFTPRPRNLDEQLLIRRLRDAERGRPALIAGTTTLSRAAIKRLMRPLPKITVPGWPGA